MSSLEKRRDELGEVRLPAGRTGEREKNEGVELAGEAAAGTGSAYPTPSASSLSPKLS